MKLRNKKTGEVFNFVIKAETDPTESHFKLRTGSGGWEDGLVYGSLEELNEEWEDYEEPTEYWFITSTGIVAQDEDNGSSVHMARKPIGNYFETQEEAEKAIEKLKAWKRLKDKGVVIHSCEGAESCENFYRITFSVRCDSYWSDRSHSVDADLNLLFGGEDE